MGAAAEPSVFFPGAAGVSVAAVASAARKRLRMVYLISFYFIMEMETISMARGWESKSVESQIESAQSRPQRPTGPTPTEAQVNLLREKENLTLSRTRVLRELETSKNPRYVQLLSRELKALEARLRTLN